MSPVASRLREAASVGKLHLMRILVTGAGFIGSHLCECLLRDGHALAIVGALNDFTLRLSAAISKQSYEPVP